MGRKGLLGKGKKRKNKVKDCPEKSHYEEFGEAHPLGDKTFGKRLKVKDNDENEVVDEGFHVDEDSSEEEQDDTDAVSKLLATFNSNASTAIDSDDEEEEDDDGEDDGEDDDNSEEHEMNNGGNSDFMEDGIKDDLSETTSAGENDVVGGSTESHSEEEKNGIQEEISKSLQRADKGHGGTLELSKRFLKKSDKEEFGDDDDEEDTSEDRNDPFKKHFGLNISSEIAEEVQKSDNWTHSFEEWSSLKRVKIDIPKVEIKQPKLLLLANEESETELPNIAAIPKPPPHKRNYTLDDYHVLKPMKDNFLLVADTSASCSSGLTNFQKELFTIMSNYSDLYYPQASYEKFEEIKTVYALHALNHVLKTRKSVLRHNSKLKKSLTKKKRKKEPDHCFRDQGYTRPKVLIILPFKHSAYRLVEIMCLLLQDKNFEILKQSRFREDFGPGQNQDLPKNLNRAEDFHEVFKGNTKEDFKIGLKITKRTLKLYSDFYQSDIIISSPLGLRCLMGNFQLSSAETDFLTSIEVLIIDQADVLMMQNWEHLLVLMEVLNKPPHDIHKLDTDLTRIRMWTLEGHSSVYRQTMLFSATNIDHGRALINKCKNFTGRMQVLNHVQDGSVQEVVVPAELVMIRVAGMRDPDSRFNYFVKEVLPQYQANRRIGILVYIPDYCDYVRLVKYLKEDGGVSFSSINEYMTGEMYKVAKVRSLFFDAKRQFLLYTERFHFYRRYCIKGVRHVIFYDLPTYPHFFSEICNLMVDGNQNRRTQKKHVGNNTVCVLYQQSDITKVVGVLGSQRAGEIIKAQKSLHICAIGS